ncbi:uncharacterized protein KY384_005440 [Bacidia gigantensis]|uniref:uncharacterized protein n=1 Tax=Bacidia gigantensis TaxID=2732470 RepID=UPI001D04C126|nr:uncharacterized protein KY384_005440 [Bacidia gigantensis]KAG8529959.1 hypothetical protein KY384_005440 [Bacidia gigantensis]
MTDMPIKTSHLDKNNVENLVKPSQTTSDLVHEFLKEQEINVGSFEYSPARDWIKVSLPVKDVERLLDTKYSVYEHEDGDRLVRAPTWSLPAHLHGHIDTIQPTNSFFRPQGRRMTYKTITPIEQLNQAPKYTLPSLNNTSPDNITVSAACNASAVTSLCLRTLYGTLDYKPQAPDKVSIGLTDFLMEANNRSDVRIFLERFRPDAVSAADSFAVDVINGGDNQQTPDTPEQLDAGKDLEGNLDAETILGIDYPIPLTAFSTGGMMPPFIPDQVTPDDTNEPYAEFLDYILGLPSIPAVISSSYGDDEQTVPESYATRVCASFAQLGARGVSFLCSSGDSGVGTSGKCVSNDGQNTPEFLPSFPDGCPYVTSVGATKNFNPEVAAFDARNNFASGGGFSNYFGRPKYQDVGTVVMNYIDGLAGKFDGLYNKSGRAYPDISAQGQHYVTIWNGSVTLLDGTSASCPTASSILTLVNDALVAAGKPVLGFLNPWLYSKGYAAFTDILSGSAIGCNSDGFPATKGWDPVTGFGTPFFPNVKSLALETYVSLPLVVPLSTYLTFCTSDTFLMIEAMPTNRMPFRTCGTNHDSYPYFLLPNAPFTLLTTLSIVDFGFEVLDSGTEVGAETFSALSGWGSGGRRLALAYTMSTVGLIVA